jgi:hypothetical protein
MFSTAMLQAWCSIKNWPQAILAVTIPPGAASGWQDFIAGSFPSFLDSRLTDSRRTMAQPQV